MLTKIITTNSDMFTKIITSQSWARTLYLMGKDPLPTHYYLHVCACPH